MSTKKKIAMRTGNRAAGLIRVSSESQVEGHSLEAQHVGIERWCQQKGYVFVKEYREAGVSAYTDEIEKRPELINLMKDAEAGLFDIVVVHTLDRLARALTIQIQVLSRLKKIGVTFASVNDPIDASNPIGQYMLNSFGNNNELFSAMISVHVNKAFQLMAESGLTIGSVPFGYQRQQDKKSPPVKVAGKAEAVFEVFKLRDEGQSYGEIAAWVTSKGFRTLEGNAFTDHAIKDMLNNHYYCGWVEYHDKEFKGKHEAIISEELFQKVQVRRHKREFVRTVHGPKGLLQGIVACAVCGHPLHSDRHRQQTPMYRERHALECATNNTATVAGVIDKQVETIVTSLELHTEWRDKMAKLAMADYDGPSLESLREKRRRLGKAYADEMFSDEEYKWRLAEIDNQIQQATTVTTPDMEEAVKLFSNIPELWNEATIDERKRLLRTLIERVYIDMKKRVVTTIKPTPAFRVLLGTAIDTIPNAPLSLLPGSETQENVGHGGDGGGSNSPSRKSCPECATGLVVFSISPDQPLSTGV